MKYKYYIYGLHVESDIELPECYEDDSAKSEEQLIPDVRVVLGEMPEEVREMTADKGDDEFFVTCNPVAMVFRIASVADYHITADLITVRQIADVRSQEVKTFLLGSSFGYCMVLRKRVTLHGGGVALNGNGVIITGDSGAGKSTVTNKLLERGYMFIADDVCSISLEQERVHINMAYPQQKLCRDAAVKRGYDLSELIYINEERDKFAVRLKDGFLPGGEDFKYLFEIALDENPDSESATCEEVQGHAKLMLLLRNIYRGEGSFETWGMPVDYMRMCLEIAKQVKIFRIVRPAGKDTLDQVIGIIEEIVI